MLYNVYILDIKIYFIMECYSCVKVVCIVKFDVVLLDVVLFWNVMYGIYGK